MIQLAGIPLRIGFRLPETAKYYSRFLLQEDCPEYDIAITEEDIDTYPEQCADGVLHPYDEHYMLIARASQFLLKRHRVLIHGVAFVWKGKAWLITAPSGTGKTTQLRHWQHLWNDQIALISGDKPVLEMKQDGRIWLYPSPWTGKEGDIGEASGELAGIVLLQQSGYNDIYRMKPRDAALKLFLQFLILGETGTEFQAVGEIESFLLRNIPIWCLENTGDEASAVLTYQTLLQCGEIDNETI